MPNPPPNPAPTDNDLLPVVDERDQVIDVQPRRVIHERGLLHRAVQVWVVDDRDRVWLQRRAPDKDTFPDCWDASCTGHVDPGETYDQAARRELREELGIDAAPVRIGRTTASKATGWEFQSIYLLRWDADPQANPAEITDMRLCEIGEIHRLLANPSPQFPMTPGVGFGLLHLGRILAAHGSVDPNQRPAPPS